MPMDDIYSVDGPSQQLKTRHSHSIGSELQALSYSVRTKVKYEGLKITDLPLCYNQGAYVSCLATVYGTGIWWIGI